MWILRLFQKARNDKLWGKFMKFVCEIKGKFGKIHKKLNLSEFKGKNKVTNSLGAVTHERTSKLKFRSLIAFSLHFTLCFC